jgi:hypothetical protein
MLIMNYGRLLSVPLILCSLNLAYASKEDIKTPELISCESTKEYVTTVQFLRDKKDFGLNNAGILKIADEISLGCNGASQRFIKVTTLLTKVGIDTKSSLETAKKFAAKGDSFVKAFITIFKQTYSSSELDLDALSAMKISTKLSVEFDGTVEHAVSDFNELATFCKNRKEMDLPLPHCAQMATRVTRLGQKYDTPIATPFIKLVKFLEESKKGPEQPKSQVIKIAEKVIANGPIASENFINAYKYAVKKDGLGISDKDAIAFGIKMSKRSYSIK